MIDLSHQQYYKAKEERFIKQGNQAKLSFNSCPSFTQYQRVTITWPTTSKMPFKTKI